MKRVIFAAVALLAFGSIHAQTARFGVKGGLNVSTLSGGVDTSPKVGAHVGGLVEIKVVKKFSIQPELLLSFQGAKSDYSYVEPGYSYNRESTTSLTYLNIPVIAKFYVIPKLSLEAGPQLGILVGAKNKYSVTENDGGEITAYSSTVSDRSGLKGADAAFDLGASYYFTDNMFLQARFCIGISDVYDGPRKDDFDDDYYYDNGTSNNVFQLSFGYRF